MEGPLRRSLEKPLDDSWIARWEHRSRCYNSQHVKNNAESFRGFREGYGGYIPNQLIQVCERTLIH